MAMGVFGLVGRRLTRSLAPGRRLHSPLAVAQATLRPHPLLEQPRIPPSASSGRMPQVFGGRACSSNGTAPQLSNGITPTSQLSKVETSPPCPAPLLPKGYAKDLEKLSDGIADLDADFTILFHMIWVLYGLIFAVILKIPGTVGDVDGKTSDLEARLLAAVEQSNCIKRDQASLEVEVIKRNAKKVSSQTTTP